MPELAGWLGTLCFSLCGVPQAVKCYREGRAEGLSSLFLWLWVAGELFSLVYVWYERFSYPLIINYIFNLFLLFFILKYHYWPVTPKSAIIGHGCCHNKEHPAQKEET